MNRRWQADGIPLWRKIFSSNWWWYGEVNPDPASLPPLENRPKFWQWDAVAWYAMFLLVPLIFWLAPEVNSRYWSFNQTSPYVGRITQPAYTYPQFQVELQDKTVVSMGFPAIDFYGYRKQPWRPVGQWMSTVDDLLRLQHQCPNRLLVFDAEMSKLTVNPQLNIWGVRCMSGANLMTQEQIANHWHAKRNKPVLGMSGFCGFCIVLVSLGIVRRERKRYVKS